MSVDDKEPRDPQGPEDQNDSTSGEQPVARERDPYAPEPKQSDEAESKTPAKTVYDDPYDDDFNYENDDPDAEDQNLPATEPAAAPPPPPQQPTTDLDDDDDDDEEGMARMSFLEHLEELRTRIIRSAAGLVAAYVGCLALADHLFRWFKTPFAEAARQLPYDPPLQLTQITPTEQFMIMYFKLPLLAGIFVGAPWLMYQAWAFISPGLYKKERRWAVPFIVSTAALFILGGVFCYFIALRFALGFLVGLGYEADVRPMISISSYYDMFFNLHVGLGAVFQMPIVIFFFTLLRITSPAFLLKHGRYAILIIFVIAAVITPTPDVTTMLTFAAPMVLLYYIGIAASYLIVLKREGRGFPWRALLIGLFVLALLVALAGAGLHYFAGWQLTPNFPWLQPGA